MTEYTNDIIKEALGDNHLIPYGWHIIIQPYNQGDNFVDQTGAQSIFERPDSAKDRDLTQLGVGKILMIGDAAFKANQFKDWTLKPEIGEYVAFPKYEGTPIKYSGVDCIGLKDYLVMFRVPDPALYGYYSFSGN